MSLRRVNIPNVVPTSPEDEVGVSTIEAMDVCRFLRMDTNGRAICACREVKDHPDLGPCKKWKGNAIDS